MKESEEICNYLNRRFSLKYEAKSQVLVTVGGSEAIDLCIRSLVQPAMRLLSPSELCLL